MSLINKALKAEQRRRETSFQSVPPMAMSMQRRQKETGSKLLVGFTLLGATLAVSAGAFVYFGTQYLQNKDAPQPQLAVSIPLEEKAEVQSEKPLVPEATSPAPSPAALPEEASSPAKIAPEKGPEQYAIQDKVDAYSVQGIRKLGADTRVFLNGRIQKMGDVIEPKMGLRLIGFQTGELIFEDADGFRYSKRF